MSFQSQYSDRVIAGMQMLFGKGFLSPGGAPEVEEMLAGVDLDGLHVLDLGCGIGGGALMLARAVGAGRVTAVDIEADSIARAAQAAEKEGLARRIDFRHVVPGPLPLDNESFDLVFTKDVICHIADKPAVFAEAFRVLKPGGRLLCADFLDGEADGEADAEFRNWVDVLKTYGLRFHYEGLDAYRAALAGAGFVDVETRDHTATSAAVARREHEFVTSPAAAPVREALGEDYFKVRIETSATRARALEARGVLHFHILARRPA